MGFAPLAPLALLQNGDDDNAEVSWTEAKASVRDTLVDIWQQVVEHTPFMVAGVLLLIATAVTAFLVRRLALGLLRRSRLRRSLRELLGRLIFLAVWFAGLLACAMVVFPGLTPTKALGGLGIASVAVGFAFKDIFENFFAGILILWRFPFDAGDYVATGSVMGRIEEITIRNTLIRQPTDELVVVPNSRLFTEPVEVLTHGELRRATMVCGVAYESDLELACESIRKALENSESVSSEPAPQVFPRDFNDSSIDIEVAWWTSPEPLALRRSRAEVVHAIKRGLEEANVEIPFPQRVLSFKTESESQAVLGRSA